MEEYEKNVKFSGGGVKCRIDWIDTAKGLGMVLVIYGHLLYGGIWSIVNRAIYSFHMPMYFVLSGYVAHRRTTTLKSYFSRKAYELLLPSAIFIVATLPIYYFFTRDSGTNLSEHLKTILFVNGQVAYNSPIWFLIVLFQIIVVFEIIRGIQYPIPVKAVTALLLFVLGYLVYTFSVSLPFGTDKTIICLGFFMTGSLMRDLCEILPKRVFPAIVCVSAILWFLCGVVFNGKVSLYRMELGRYWLFIASGLTGSILWFGICWTLRKVSVFQRWGQNTIFVVCTQYVGITLFRTVMSHIKLTSTVYFDIIALVVSSAAMFAYMPICSFINVYLPFLAGKEEKICRV